MDQDSFFQAGTLVPIGEGGWIAGQGKKRWLKEPEGLSFYAPDFFLEAERPWFAQEETVRLSPGELASLIADKGHAPLCVHWSSPGKDLFQSAFKEIKDSFCKTKLRKAVPYVFEEADGGFETLRLSRALNSLFLQSRQSPLLMYGFWDEKGGMAGGTPEILFKVKGRRLSTVACAGTWAEEGFCPGDKEIFEHEVVVDGIVSALNNFGKVEVGKREEVRFSRLSHLVTPIEAALSVEASPEILIKALHPTPALGGYPQAEAKKWLLSYQTHNPRGRYGAPFGYYDTAKKEGCFIVAIRNLQWGREKMRLGAGCGVVPESELNKEWQEIQWKLHAIKEMLAL